jgi:putative transposase
MRTQELSGYTGKAYPVRLVLKASGLSSASWYGKSRRKLQKQRPGPKPAISDDLLLAAIREDLATTRFHSEGHKKVRARLHRQGLTAGRKRFLRIMGAHQLLAPMRPKSNGSARRHDGTIITNKPNEMWGTDGKQFWTRQEGSCWFFGVIDHCDDEILGWHTAKTGDRFAALEPVRQALVREFGSLTEGVALKTGLHLRKDHGSQYDSKDFLREIEYFGIIPSPAFVRSPQCNGCMERFNRTLQEQVFDVNNFETIEEARAAIATFIEDYNQFWLIERLGYRSPREARIDHQQTLLKSA